MHAAGCAVGALVTAQLLEEVQCLRVVAHDDDAVVRVGAEPVQQTAQHGELAAAGP